MILSEEASCFLEEHISELADAAFKQAYWAVNHLSEKGNIV